MAMFPNPNMYGNHNYEPHGGAAWMHQQQQQQSNHHTQHQVQQQAVAAAAAQQQHYNRIAGAHNNGAAAGLNSNAQLHDNSNLESNVSEDNRRTLNYVADLLKEGTREAALLELSKKREQVPELALILWHSFGRFYLHGIHIQRNPY